jgi:signal transduction histidine kinase/ActR/RegA family two-component response regulator
MCACASYAFDHAMDHPGQEQHGLERMRRELQERTSEFETLLSVIPVGIGIALDRACTNIRINPAFAAMLDVPADANASKTAPPEERPTSFRVLNARGQEVADADLPMQIAAREGRTVVAEEFDIVRGDGSVLRLLEYAVPLFDAAGAPRGVVGAFVDITERREQEHRREEMIAAERAARAEAERVGRMKDEFLLTLSHELRTPLNAVLGWAQLLRARQAPDTLPDARTLDQALEVIERNALAQARLIDDLLDMSTIISGKVHLDIRRVSLIDVLDAAMDVVRPGAEAKGIRLQHTLDQHAGQVSGDAARLQQVFWNLLTNAVKFTPAGGRVHVVLERVYSHVEVSVADTGQGIPPEFLPAVFERFRQLDASTARRHGGLGLGLSIARSLVELHGGSVRVKSAGEGQGATFIVSLPLPAVELGHAATAAAQPNAWSAAAGQPDLNGLTVLLVDDQADSLDLLAHVLRERGAHTIACVSSLEALANMGREAPDILISDIGMPQMDGYALIREVRAMQGDVAQVPAIALTAYARAEDRHRALLAGYQLHLAKPVSGDELVAGVASLARQRQR